MAVALHVCLKRTRATRASQHRQHMCTSVPQNHTTCVFCCVSRKHACWLVRLDLRVAVRLHTRGRMSVCVCTREGDPRLTELGSCFSRTFSTVTKSSSGERERERERECVCVCVCERERERERERVPDVQGHNTGRHRRTHTFAGRHDLPHPPALPLHVPRTPLRAISPRVHSP